MAHSYKIFSLFGAVLLLLAVSFTPANAQSRVEKEVRGYAEAIANFCTPDQWTGRHCFKVLSQSNTVLAANYIAALKQSGNTEGAGHIENGCAASTALDQVDNLSRESAASALTECINMFSDVAQKTDIVPNPDHYQLLLSAVYCLRTDTVMQCQAIEKSLQPFIK